MSIVEDGTGNREPQVSYKIVYGSTVEVLQREVNAALWGGWSIHGAIAIDATTGMMYQPVIKEIKKTEGKAK